MEIIEEQDKEMESLRKRNKEIYEGFMATTQELCEATKEIERLNNAINKAIEYINNSSCFDGSYMNKHDLLMLLSGIIVRSDKE